jgi:hypothetical protein
VSVSDEILGRMIGLPTYVDRGGAVYDIDFDRQGDVGTFKGTVDFGDKGRHPGFHLGSHDTSRLLREFPDEDAFDQALLAFAKMERRSVQDELRTWLKTDPWRFYSETFGFRDPEIDEWEAPHKVNVKFKWGRKVKSTRWDRWVPLTMAFTAEARRKPSVKGTPLSDMSDRQLNEVIEEMVGPEGIWMDGELPRSQYPARMRQLREEYRRMSPRQQQDVMGQYSKYNDPKFWENYGRGASATRVALRHLEARASADDRYKFHLKNVQRSMSAIHRLLDKHAREQSREQANWGYVGDMEHVSELLRDIETFLG